MSDDNNLEKIDKRRIRTPEQKAALIARHAPASGIPAKGQLHPYEYKPARAFSGGRKHAHHVDKVARMPEKLRMAEEFMATIHEIATDETQPGGVRVMAAKTGLERIEGMAVQRVISGTVETVEEIRTRDPVEASRAYQRVIAGK